MPVLTGICRGWCTLAESPSCPGRSSFCHADPKSRFTMFRAELLIDLSGSSKTSRWYGSKSRYGSVWWLVRRRPMTSLVPENLPRLASSLNICRAFSSGNAYPIAELDPAKDAAMFVSLIALMDDLLQLALALEVTMQRRMIDTSPETPRKGLRAGLCLSAPTPIDVENHTRPNASQAIARREPIPARWTSNTGTRCRLHRTNLSP